MSVVKIEFRTQRFTSIGDCVRGRFRSNRLAEVCTPYPTRLSGWLGFILDKGRIDFEVCMAIQEGLLAWQWIVAKEASDYPKDKFNRRDLGETDETIRG